MFIKAAMESKTEGTTRKRIKKLVKETGVKVTLHFAIYRENKKRFHSYLGRFSSPLFDRAKDHPSLSWVFGVLPPFPGQLCLPGQAPCVLPFCRYAFSLPIVRVRNGQSRNTYNTSIATVLQSMMNIKLSQQRFWSWPLCGTIHCGSMFCVSLVK